MEGRQYEKLLILSDTHVPYHDKKAVALTLKIIKAFRPHTIIHIGDLLDFMGLARFDNKDPRKLGKLQDELDQAYGLLRDWREAAPNAEFYYLRGNHEYRLTKYVRNFAPEFHNLPGLTLPKMLSLDDLQIKYIERGAMDYHGLLVKHGDVVRSRSGYTATAELEKSGSSGLSGHTHRLGQVYSSNRSGMYTWVEAGCICRKDMDYLEGATPNWQTGIAFGYFTTDRNKRFEIHTLPFINNKVTLEGQEIVC